MYLTSISLSYLFLAISIIDLILLFYFKTLVIKTSEKNNSRDKIIGNMKNPEDWRGRNNRMAYVALFWTIVSLAAFIYLKYFYGTALVSTYYLIIYLVVMAVTYGLFGIKRKASI